MAAALPRYSEEFTNAFPVTPDDATNLDQLGCRLWIGTSGHLRVDLSGGDDNVLFSNVAAGLFPAKVNRVRATGTTALLIVAVYTP